MKEIIHSYGLGGKNNEKKKGLGSQKVHLGVHFKMYIARETLHTLLRIKCEHRYLKSLFYRSQITAVRSH